MSKTLEEKHDEIWELIRQAKVGMLTTVNHDTLRAGPMYVAQKGYEGELWFFTERTSAKVFEALANRNVNISFTNIEKDIYLYVR